MHRFRRRLLPVRSLLILAIILFTCAILVADIRLPAVLGDHMVLQQGMPARIWGWAAPGETVSVAFAGQALRAKADAKGKWLVSLSPLSATSDPRVMTITGDRSGSRSIADILVGEVWVCSGQSNMEWSMNAISPLLPDSNRADHPQIRLFYVPRRVAAVPEEDVEAAWEVCRPETIRNFSAVAYYFGRELHLKHKFPLGLIESAWGGTRIEPWTPAAGFEAVPETKEILAELPQADEEYRQKVTEVLPELAAWMKTAQAAAAKGQTLPVVPELPLHPLLNLQKPTALYNGMVHPLTPFLIRGAIWYQGESNRNDGLAYAKKMEALIRGWRSVWKAGDFPFYYVQLAPYNYSYSREIPGGDIPDLDRLPYIWEAQVEAMKIPNTGMAVITDIGNLGDIHPRNKEDVGRRLALWARAKVYGESGLVYSGPLYKSMSVEGNKVRLSFDHSGSGLMTLDGQPPAWFEIAGDDRVFYKATAEIDGNTVVVWSLLVTRPAAVRMGWHQLAEPNLANKEGLPASPFRTDRW